MSPRMIHVLAVILALAVIGGVAPHVQAHSSRAVPQLAGSMPEVEGRVLQALQTANLTGQLIWIAADTNGHLTLAWLVLTYDETLRDPVPAIQAYAWDLVRTTFPVVPGLDELHLTGLPRGSSPFGANRHLVTFTAAVSRGEFLDALKNDPAQQPFALFPRVWFHPALLQPQGRLPGAGRRPSSPGLQAPLQPDRPGAFQGNRLEWARELRRQIAGIAYGGIIGGELYHGDPSRRAVALTFDDGPFPLYTTLLLDTLARLRINATFFLVGEQVQQYPYFATAIVAAGHEVANHTYHHPNLTQLSGHLVEEELLRTQEAITAVTGQTPRYFRPPGGDYNETVLLAARSLGLVTVFWTDDPGDYANLGPRSLEFKTLANVTDGGILLLHQGVEDTIRILPQTAEMLQRRGFVITTVTGLLLPERSRQRAK